jgi:hypothetical protein
MVTGHLDLFFVGSIMAGLVGVVVPLRVEPAVMVVCGAQAAAAAAGVLGLAAPAELVVLA